MNFESKLKTIISNQTPKIFTHMYKMSDAIFFYLKLDFDSNVFISYLIELMIHF